MSLNTTLTFPCGFSQQETDEHILETVVLKAQCRRPAHTLSSDTLMIIVRLQGTVTYRSNRFLVGNPPVWFKSLKRKQTEIKDTHAHTDRILNVTNTF